jgi:hypothetical protein
MVDRENWGELKSIIKPRKDKFLKSLCYILDLPISAPNKDERIEYIIDSEYSFDFVIERYNFLDFGIDLLNYYKGSEIRRLRDEYGLEKHSRNRDNMIEIIKSEIVTPRQLLGPLSDEELEDMLDEFEDLTYSDSRPGMILEIIQAYNLTWLEEVMDQGFIVMPIGDDSDLHRVYEVIKEVSSTFDINAIRIDEVQTSGKITDEILEEIQQSRYFFVDLTNSRPNVYYELGYIHGLQNDNRNIILMAKKGTVAHFDIRDMRIIYYKSIDQLRKRLIQRLESIND